MTAPTEQLDSRVTDPGTGLPVARRKVMRWFTIIRAASATGVNLVTRIPGYLNEITPHPTQDAAERAAHRIYAGYRDAVRALSGQPEDQED